MKCGKRRMSILAVSLLLNIPAYARDHLQFHPDYIPRFAIYPSPLYERAKIMSAPPVNDFRFDVTKLADAVLGAFIPVERKIFADGKFVSQDDTVRHNFEKTVLTSAQLANLETARASADAATAYKTGSDLPPIARAYTAGAVAFKHNDLPGALRRLREGYTAEGPSAYKIWSAYMLGRTCAKLGEENQAHEAFSTLRDMVLKGIPDPLGLAAASYGEEARMALDKAGSVLGEAPFSPERPERMQQFHEAVRLYALQARLGSGSGLDSLHILAKDIKNVPSDFTLLMKDELNRRLFLAYVRGYGISRNRRAYRINGQLHPMPEGGLTDRKEFVTALLALFPTEDQEIADQLAASAYEIGNFDLASRYLSQKQGAYSTWIEARLALHNKDFEKAAALYETALRQRQEETINPSIDPDNEMPAHEKAILTLARGHYVKSFEEFYGLPTHDVVYLAHRVLTIDELQHFIDANIPQSAAVWQNLAQDLPQKELSRKVEVAMKARELRSGLAERLMRVGRYHEALPYLQDWQQKSGAAYVKYLDAAGSARNASDKAEALFQAAQIMRESGDMLMGSVLIDLAAPDGNLADNPFVTAGELKRLAASRSETSFPPSFRQIAVDEALQAADLLPPRSQAFAASLCHATDWMQPLDREASNAIYQYYIKQGAIVRWATHFGHHCPDPEFQATKHFWFTHAVVWGRRVIARHHSAILYVLFGMLSVIGVAAAGYHFRHRLRRG